MRAKAKLLACFLLPGAAVSAMLSLSVILEWPSGQLYYGAASLAEMWRSIVESTLFELNPNLVNPLLYPFLAAAGPYLLAAAAGGAAAQLALLLLHRGQNGERRRTCLALLPISACVVAVGAHWLCFRYAGLLLPKERTALYAVPLITVFGGAVAALQSPRKVSRLLRGALVASLWGVAVYFLLCLRLTYFKEWKWDADVREAYSVLSHYNHSYGLESVCSNWRFSSGLNFYRLRSGKETLPAFEALETYPPDASAYVLYEPFEGGFIREQGLEVVYRGGSGLVIAARPSRLTRPSPARSPGPASPPETPCPHGSARAAPDKPA